MTRHPAATAGEAVIGDSGVELPFGVAAFQVHTVHGAVIRAEVDPVAGDDWG